MLFNRYYYYPNFSMRKLRNKETRTLAQDILEWVSKIKLLIQFLLFYQLGGVLATIQLRKKKRMLFKQEII